MNFNNTKFKKTKIIATTGPTFEALDIMKKMFEAGVNTIRLNTSHGDKAEHLVRIVNAKKLRKEMDLPISILLDTKGPEIRVHQIKDKKMPVKRGDLLTIYSKKEIEGSNGSFSVTYKDLTTTVKKGDAIMVDDGKLSLIVEAIDAKQGIVKAKALNDHYVGTKKAVNIPGADLTLPFISEYDKDMIKWGIQQDIDYIAASFVRTGKDVLELREFLNKHGGSRVKIMSKVEALKALHNLNDIVKHSDAIMIARGDLGVEIPFEQVPFYQKLITEKCRAWGKPVVTATQMLDSMQSNPRPTRAEVTDVYFAALSGTDATMLSGESSLGDFPLDAVNVMSKVNIEGENNFNYLDAFETAYAFVSSENAESAYKVAHQTLRGEVKLIVAFSEKGRLVNALSRFRPNVPILALLKDEKLVYSFGATYGVYAQHHSSLSDFNDDAKVKLIVKKAGIKSGKVIVANKDKFRIISL